MVAAHIAVDLKGKDRYPTVAVAAAVAVAMAGCMTTRRVAGTCTWAPVFGTDSHVVASQPMVVLFLAAREAFLDKGAGQHLEQRRSEAWREPEPELALKYSILMYLPRAGE